MSNERLNSLTLINMHKDVRNDHAEIATKYLQAPAIPLLVNEQDDPEIDFELMNDPGVHEYVGEQQGVQDFMDMLNEE